MDKAELRKSMLYKRNLISAEEKSVFDERIIEAFLNLENYKKANNICIYVNYGSEINTKKIIEKALDEEKSVFVPRIKKNREMEFIKIDSIEELEKNKIGILEPKKEFTEKVEKIELLVLPGLAFDLNGGRIGYGGGYYDRYLDNKDILKIALSYELQILNEIPMEEHDIKYDYLITEKRIVRI
ncbi:MAG: 5-formyltetrahydrofolate cyclo-ligase [Clostridium sp.]|uniref:5-formyltetrahydrofolate cyclo-ligase n=1 Tax=Clostridium sp. TaxID=1506 RepID=UPI003F2BD109